MSQDINRAVDRLDEIASVWALISDLATPSDDLHGLDRGNMANALYFLQREYEAANERLHEAVQKDIKQP